MAKEDEAAMVAMQRRADNKAIELLLGMVTGIVADQQLHDMEIKFLSSWLAENEYAASVWPGCVIAQRIRLVMEDGVITDEERSHLLETLQQVAVSNFADTGSAASEVLQLPLQDDGHVDIRDRHICLTGEFIFGTRSTCEKISQAVGALPVSSVTKKVAYLVIGTNVSPHWAHTSYGRKIEQAIELQQNGHPIRIISERKWRDFIQAWG